MTDLSPILFVDDEPRNLFLFRRLFEKQYDVHTAESGEEALDLVAREDVRLVISDQKMPGMTGVELLATLYRDRPEILRLLTTGYSDIESVILAINQGHVYRYVPKPWRKKDLGPVLDQAIAEYRRANEVRRQLEALEERLGAARALRGRLDGGTTSDEATEVPEESSAFELADSPSILYVDDEPNNLVVFRAAFSKLYRVHTAASADEALRLLGDETIHIVVADQRMPGTTGVELMRKMIDDYPETLRIILTGYIDIDAAVLAINSGRVHGYVTKPWRLEQLAEMIEEASIFHDGHRWEQRRIARLQAAIEREHAAIRELGGTPPGAAPPGGTLPEA